MKLLNLLLSTALLLIGFFFVSPVALATSHDDTAAKRAVCEGIGALRSGDDCTEPAEGNVSNLVARIVSVLSWIAGIAAVIMVVISGMKYITSSGDANKVGAAKKTLTYALVGLAVAVLTQVIVRFVVTEATTPPSPSPVLNPGAP